MGALLPPTTSPPPLANETSAEATTSTQAASAATRWHGFDAGSRRNKLWYMQAIPRAAPAFQNALYVVFALVANFRRGNPTPPTSWKSI